jgi:hypothetical protein
LIIDTGEIAVGLSINAVGVRHDAMAEGLVGRYIQHLRATAILADYAAAARYRAVARRALPTRALLTHAVAA